MPKAEQPDIDSLRKELEAVVRGWMGKSHLSMEEMSTVSAITSRFLKDVEKNLSGTAFPPEGFRVVVPRHSKRVGQGIGGKGSDRKEKLLAVLEQSKKELRIRDVVQRAASLYPEEKWDTRVVSTILGREWRRSDSRIVGRKRGKNFLYKFKTENNSGQLALKGEEAP